MLSDRAGGLALAPGSPFVLGGEPYPPALGDLDGDGRLDLVAPLVGAQKIAVMLGDGRGGFSHAPESPHAVALPRPYKVALGDLDRDGTLDVIAPHDDTDEMSVLLGRGDGRLRDAAGSPLPIGRRIGQPAVIDADGDGALDVVGAGSGALVVLRGDGRGGLQVARTDAAGDAWTMIAADLGGCGEARCAVPDLAVPDADAAVVRIWPGPR
jgi:hypothetical protein